MKSIAISNNKGGVGKTTTAGHQAIFNYNPQARSIEYYNILAGAY